MAKKHIASINVREEESEINLTPMLDVVFIMLIFFIVTATFIRETGLEVTRPEQSQAQVVEEEGQILRGHPAPGVHGRIPRARRQSCRKWSPRLNLR